ncbi:hypothetical protein H8356DRAFT_1341560 [Neocallimastix lanati (nom. inval.)]|nr:hypothetical protein H8356DRAFT_1341560 [Neocallimastix sp. JGI-2020a]
MGFNCYSYDSDNFSASDSNCSVVSINSWLNLVQYFITCNSSNFRLEKSPVAHNKDNCGAYGGAIDFAALINNSQQQIVSKLEEKIEYKLITTTRKISKKRVKKFTRAEPSWTRIKRKNGSSTSKPILLHINTEGYSLSALCAPTKTKAGWITCSYQKLISYATKIIDSFDHNQGNLKHILEWKLMYVSFPFKRFTEYGGYGYRKTRYYPNCGPNKVAQVLSFNIIMRELLAYGYLSFVHVDIYVLLCYYFNWLGYIDLASKEIRLSSRYIICYEMLQLPQNFHYS